MQLTVIIVNYKTPRLLLNAVTSVFTETKSVEFEVIVVDNHSEDDSEKIILAAHPQVRWIDMGYNAGFARANNRGILESDSAAILLLNPDTIIEGNAIATCYHQLMDSSYIACGIQLLNADRTPQISGLFFVKGGLNYLLPLPFMGNVLKSFAESVRVKKPNIAFTRGVEEVDWINGAFLMVKREAIEKAGLMDEDFFLYAEETEWCSRLRKAGKLCLFGNIQSIHLEGGTADAVFQSEDMRYNLFGRKGRQIMVSNFVRIRKQYGSPWFLFLLLFYILEIPVFAVGVFFSQLFKQKQYDFSDVHSYTANVFYVVRILPIILRNQPHLYKVL
jgi:GT2 family glycosyltransferase